MAKKMPVSSGMITKRRIAAAAFVVAMTVILSFSLIHDSEESSAGTNAAVGNLIYGLGSGTASVEGVAPSGIGLAEITIPATVEYEGVTYNVTSIGYSAFEDCTYLVSLTMPEGIERIESSAFEGCTALKSAVIPDSVTSLGSDVFWGCHSLEFVNISKGVTSIGDNQFWECTDLETINVDADNPNFKSVGGVLYSKDGTKLIIYPPGKAGSFVVPEGVTSIENRAFSQCDFLTSVTISDGVTSIGSYAFTDSYSLTSVTISDSVTSIDSSAFEYCMDLRSIEVGTDNPNYKSVDGVLYSKDGTQLIRCPAGKAGDLLIPSGVTAIRDSALSECMFITSVTIPDSVTSIEDYAFYDCTSITSFTIPDSVTSVGRYLFAHCSSMTTVSLPESMTALPDGLFSRCNALTSVIIPSGVTSVGVDVFQECSSLTSVTIPSGVIDLGEYVFGDCTSLTSITIPDGVNSLPESVFDGCTSLTSVTIPNSVTSIGDYAFYRCTSLTSVTIPSGVTSIGDSAFYKCTSLTSVTIPAGVETIPLNTFLGCTSLTSVTISSGVETIQNSAFYGCTSLTSVIIPDSVTSIGYSAFSGCTSLTAISVDGSNPNYKSVDGVLYSKDGTKLIACPAGKSGAVSIPGDVTHLENSAFEGCTSLTSLSIPSSLSSIGYDVFIGCTSLTDISVDGSNPNYKSVDGVLYSKDGSRLILYPSGKTGASFSVPSDVTTIESGAFAYSTLTSITIPSGVTSIDSGAFGYCESLTSITIPSGVTSIESGTFVQCTSLTSIIIPSSVTSIDDYVFYGCTSLANIDVDSANTAFKSIDGMLYSKDGRMLILCPSGKAGTINLSENVTIIEYSAFEDCVLVTAINVDAGNLVYKSVDGVLYSKNGVEVVVCPQGKVGELNIQQGVLYLSIENECGSITSVTIPDSVFEVVYSFNGWTSLRSVTMPEGFAISFYSLNECASLESVTLSDRTVLFYETFEECPSLTSVTIKGTTDSAVVDYGAILSNLPEVTSVTVDSPAAVDLSVIAGTSSVTKIVFTSTSANAVAEGLTFKDVSGGTITVSSELAGKTFVVDADDRTVWNQYVEPEKEYDILLYAGIAVVVIVIIGAAVFLYRRP